MPMIHIASTNSKSDLSNIVVDQDVQPNAADLRLGKVFRINNEKVFEITNEYKSHRGSVEVYPDEDGFFNLNPGHYEVVMENEINVGEGESGFVITRSTLNRNGIYLTSGLYDSGYHGMMAGAMHIKCGPARIKKGTRIGQYLCFESETLTLYDGDYGHNKQHDQKYL